MVVDFLDIPQRISFCINEFRVFTMTKVKVAGNLLDWLVELDVRMGRFQFVKMRQRLLTHTAAPNEIMGASGLLVGIRSSTKECVASIIAPHNTGIQLNESPEKSVRFSFPQ